MAGLSSLDELDLKVGGGRTCAACGQPCRGFASASNSMVVNGKWHAVTRYYCHPDNPAYPDCYSYPNGGDPRGPR